MSLQDVSRSFSSSGRSDASCPAWAQTAELRTAARGHREPHGAPRSPAQPHGAPHSPTYLQEGAQAAHLHPHAVQGALGELQSKHRHGQASATAALGNGGPVWAVLGQPLRAPPRHGSSDTGAGNARSAHFWFTPWGTGRWCRPRKAISGWGTGRAKADDRQQGESGVISPFTLMWSASCMVQSSAWSARWMLYRCCGESRDQHPQTQ